MVSNIYEEFYQQSGTSDSGTHYTPSTLVEYVLNQVLTSERLATNPKILDFACGSAIFLVHAFRRIVRYQEARLGRSLKAKELRQILREQITGIEINEEAVHVAAFGLYLALLHYQEPKDILAQIEQANGDKPLPHLIYQENKTQDTTHYDVLYHANAFDLLPSERKELENDLENRRQFRGRAEVARLNEAIGVLPLEPNSFDIIIGNPPWGYLKKSEGTAKLQVEQAHTLRWCTVNGWSIGDKELSQAFIARAISLLKPDGVSGLLVSSGVFLKRHEKSQKFRQRWLAESSLSKVVNFSHVRDVFFSNAISPFCFVQFSKGVPDNAHRMQYWSAKKTAFISKVQSVVLSLPDMHQVRQQELTNNELLWKVYWWGSHRDASLINALKMEVNLGQLIGERNWLSGQGFKLATERNYEWKEKYKELPIEYFKRYGVVKKEWLRQVPKNVHRLGIKELYSGWRLLIKRGITQADNANGRIEARLENKDYCFRNSLHAIKLDNAQDWERKVLIAILWSSLARYFFFTTTGSWGTWHHEIHKNDGLLNLPIRFLPESPSQKLIVEIVSELMDLDFVEYDLVSPEGLSNNEVALRQKELEHKLDEAIFDLYELNNSERDLIKDLCEVGLEFFYRGSESKAITRNAQLCENQGTIAPLPANRDHEKGLEGYLYAFLQIWNKELESQDGEFRWRIVRAPHAPMLAAVFTTQTKNQPVAPVLNDDEKIWTELLTRLDESLLDPISPRIYIDGMVRAVTDTDIIIIKRDERRLWIRSMAREDAEATLLQAMTMQQAVKG